MKTIRMIAVAALSALAIVSCNKQDPDALTVASSSLSFSAEGGAETISFETNAKWTATSDKEWIVVSPAEGEAGKATVTVTAAKNDTYEKREGTVTVKAGSKTTVFAVSQTFTQVFAAGAEVTLSYEAQEFAIPTKTNLDVKVQIVGGEGWLTEKAATKAAPVDGMKTFNVAENLTDQSRDAVIQVASGEDYFAVKVTQEANPNAVSFTSIEYIGNKQRIYDTENWAFSTFCQWVVELKNEEAATAVTLVLNGVKADVKTLNVPEGEYEIDAAATHAAKTFSIKSLDGVEKKYTTVVKNGKEIEITDGIVTVAKDGSITAKLYDDPGNTYSFFTTNAAPDVVSNTIGAQLQSVAYKANYNTYFANNNNEWNLSLYISDKVSDTTPYLGYLSLNIYGNADGELQPGAFPTGTYTVKASTEKDSGYAAGNVIADPFTIDLSDYNTVVIRVDSTTNAKILSGSVAISKEGELYKFDVKLKMQKWHYDAEWNTVPDETFDFNYVFTDVPVLDVDNNGSRPVPDGDIALTQWGMNGGYIGMWFGNSYSLTTNETTPNSVLLIGDTAIEKFNYYFYAILNTSSEWKFEKNYPPKYLYCVNKVPAGEYAFTATKPETASDFLVKNAKKYADYRAIKNNYTGTKFYYDGGKITVTNTDMTFDLTATSAGDEAHGIAPKAIKITGTLPNNVVYFRDYSAANRQAMVAWYTE